MKTTKGKLTIEWRCRYCGGLNDTDNAEVKDKQVKCLICDNMNKVKVFFGKEE